MQRIGLFGGSFDPVHKGHIQIAAGVAAYCNFDEVRFLPCAQHALGNDTDEDVIVIEVQMGSYFGEDDIVRVSDPYNR